MEIAGAIFDFDGTLVDSMYIWDNVGADYLRTLGITPEDNLNDVLLTLSLVEAAEHFQLHYNVKNTVEQIIDAINKLVEHLYFDVVKLKDGVKPLLENFKKQGVNMCIATAADKYLVEACLKRNDIFDYFGAIFTCTEVKAGKDLPIIYLKSLEFLGTDISNTYVFEDALHAIETAQKAGFSVIGVYDKFSETLQDEIKSTANIYLKSFNDWEGIL